MPDLFPSTACRCPSCGGSDEKYSRQWMRACLVRDIAKSNLRAQFLRKYAEHHGQAEAEKLDDEIMEELKR